MARNEKKVDLVLSIFKGENFVCKKPSGCKLQITAKVGQEQMESGCIQLTSTESEPQFYSQLVWTFSERDWRAIRSAKEVVKVECKLISERSSVSSVLGYCILYVKDAFLMTATNEIDPSNAHTSLLCGLKDPWKMYSPKLKLLLHFEESTFDQHSPSKSPSKAHPKVPLASDKIGQIKLPTNGTPGEKRLASCVGPPTDENVKSKSCLSFRVNSESGYFELGSLSEDDDLYILNITIISGTNLHRIPLPQKSLEDRSFWVVEYHAYGYDIKTDPFQLALEEVNSRTFIGDQAKAKIRANSVEFWNYLNNTSLEFRLLHYDSNSNTDKDVMGVGFVDLQALASPKITQLKYTLELISECDDYSPGIQVKPEIKVLVELESFPSYFSSWTMTEEPLRSDILSQVENRDNSNSPLPLPVNATIDMFATCVSDSEQNNSPSLLKSNDIAIKKTEENVEELTGALNKITLLEDTEPQSPLQKEPEQDPELINSGGYKSSPRQKLKDTVSGQQYEGFVKRNTVRSDNSKTTNVSPQIQDLESDSSSPTSQKNPSEGTDSTNKYSENTNFELNGRSMAIVPPGSYKISIKLSQFLMKCRHQLNNFKLSYAHSPVGIETPVVCSAEFNPEINLKKPDTQCYRINDGTYELSVIIPSFSEDLLGELLKVKFEHKDSSDRWTYFGFCSIPFGDIFLEKSKARNNTRRLKGEAPLYDKATKKIGKMEYEIQLTPCDFPKTDKIQLSDRRDRFFENEDVVDRDGKPSCSKIDSLSKKYGDVESKIKPAGSDLFNETEAKTNRVTEPPTKVSQAMITMAEFEAWKENEENVLKNKFRETEKAYLTILSTEYKKREAERKKFFDDKHQELLKREKEVERLANSLSSKENDLKELEHHVNITNRQKSLDQEYTQQEYEIKLKKQKDRFQTEIDMIQQRNDALNAEIKSLKGQQLILEQKLEAKEEKIRNLLESRSHSPNSELLDKVTRLELENEMVKKDLKKTEKDRHEYKNQCKSLVHQLSLMKNERDMQLKDENENLRLQILASKEQKEVRKERKEIKGLSNQLREYREKGKTKSDTEKAIQGQLKERNKDDCEMRGASCDGDSVAVNADRTGLNKELSRLAKQRQSLLDSGCYNNYDHVVKEMEERIVKLAKRLN